MTADISVAMRNKGVRQGSIVSNNGLVGWGIAKGVAWLIRTLALNGVVQLRREGLQ